jgi:hypothetical protein
VNQVYWRLVMRWLSISDEEPSALPTLLLYSSVTLDTTLASGRCVMHYSIVYILYIINIHIYYYNYSKVM